MTRRDGHGVAKAANRRRRTSSSGGSTRLRRDDDDGSRNDVHRPQPIFARTFLHPTRIAHGQDDAFTHTSISACTHTRARCRPASRSISRPVGPTASARAPDRRSEEVRGVVVSHATRPDRRRRRRRERARARLRIKRNFRKSPTV